jgi:thymidine phosphorylase
MIAAQGGDPRVCEDPWSALPAAPVRRAVPADRAGAVTAVPARAVGELSVILGAGRARKDDDVDPAVGIELRVEVGDAVEAGQPLAIVHARTDGDADGAAARLAELVAIGDDAAPPPTVLEVLRSSRS